MKTLLVLLSLLSFSLHAEERVSAVPLSDDPLTITAAPDNQYQLLLELPDPGISMSEDMESSLVDGTPAAEVRQVSEGPVPEEAPPFKEPSGMPVMNVMLVIIGTVLVIALIAAMVQA